MGLLRNSSNQAPKVLIVEDDEELGELLAMMLESRGYQVWNAANGREALKLLKKRPADLIVLDMQMPVMNGWEFAEEFHKQYGHSTPILVVTAAAEGKRCVEETGAEGWLAKPFEFDALMRMVREHVPRPPPARN